MSFRERALAFNCQGEQLLGVLATPADLSLASDVAVLVVVGGPQYRAGAHRQFVQLARALASAGHSVLRFDVRGMGDSGGAQRSFEVLTDDIEAGINTLMAQAPACKRLALMGLCDGASAALMYLHDTRDRRVNALCLLNPWLRSDESLARAQVQHYYLHRVMSPEFWRKLVAGDVGLGALKGFLHALRTSLRHRAAASAGTAANAQGRAGLNFRSAMLKGCELFNGPMLLALSRDDLTAQEFAGSTAAHAGWCKALAREQMLHLQLEAADHTLSSSAARLSFEAAVIAWLGTLHAPGTARASG